MAKKSVLDTESPFAGLNSILTASKIKTIQSSSNDTMIGIGVPSIAFQYLLGTSALPLSRAFQLVGSEGSYKSTFMYELMRWYLDSGGKVLLVETEAKDSGYIRNGVLSWDPDRITRVGVLQTTSYQEWMTAVTKSYAYFKDEMANSKQYSPLLVCVDSITAAASAESLEKIAKEGCAQPGYPDLAKNLSADFKSLPDKLSGFPFSFLFINHIKPGTNTGPYDRGVIPGGKALSYYNSLTLHLAGTQGKSYADGSSVADVKFKTYKNSNGQEGRTITTKLVRWVEPDPVHADEHNDFVAFDWNSADIQFLDKFTADPTVGSSVRSAVKDTLPLHMTKIGTKPGVWSESLGIPKDNPVSFAVAGAALHNDPVLMKRVQNVLGIRLLPEYSSGVDYQQLIVDTVALRRERLQNMSRPAVPESDVSDEMEGDLPEVITDNSI